MDKKTGVGLFAARLGVGAIFLVSALGKLAAWGGTVTYAGSKGVPPILLAGATALELVGALSLLLGWRARHGAAALIVFLVPVTIVFHAFWAAQGAEVQMQIVQFLKNVAIAGGLVAIVVSGPGPVSVDARRRAARSVGAPAKVGA